MNTSLVRESALYDHWANEESITFNGKIYRVGKMSYGEYFFEPAGYTNENMPFRKGTLWAVLVDKKRRLYEMVEG